MRGVKTKGSGKWKRIPIFLGMLLILGLMLNSVNKVYQKKKGAEELLVRMQAEKRELEERKQELEVSLERLKTEEGLKFELRRKLNVAEAGENVAIIVEAESSTSEVFSPPSLFERLKNFISNLFK